MACAECERLSELFEATLCRHALLCSQDEMIAPGASGAITKSTAAIIKAKELLLTHEATHRG